MVFLVLVDALIYPLVNASTLMQIGYEPVPAYESTTLFGRPAMALPNVVDYCWHMRARDGMWEGWYRGLAAKIFANLTARLSVDIVFLLTSGEDDEITLEAYDLMSDADRRGLFLRSAVRSVLAQAVATVTSQILHVVAVRTMSQFVGMETLYRGVAGGVAEAVARGGASGLCVGLVPRFIGEVSPIVCAVAMTYAVSTVWSTDFNVLLTWGLSYWAACKLFHPFNVVSSSMAVNNVGLAAGSPPRMPVFRDWTDCWRRLAAGGQLCRGDRFFWRFASIDK